MSWFGDPIRNGVRSGLEKAFAPGGGASVAIRDAFAAAIKPLAAERDEYRSLYAYQTRQAKLWHKIAKAMGYESDGTYAVGDFPPHVVTQIEKFKAKRLAREAALNPADHSAPDRASMPDMLSSTDTVK